MTAHTTNHSTVPCSEWPAPPQGRAFSGLPRRDMGPCSQSWGYKVALFARYAPGPPDPVPISLVAIHVHASPLSREAETSRCSCQEMGGPTSVRRSSVRPLGCCPSTNAVWPGVPRPATRQRLTQPSARSSFGFDFHKLRIKQNVRPASSQTRDSLALHFNA